ncbi:tRNA epoxyqueuosine(34) reductase QueG [soil metagenome]
MLESRLKLEATALGFSLSGIAPATEVDSFPLFERWLDAGYAGEMHYLQKHRDQRRDPESILPACRSVLMLGYEYAPPSTIPLPPSRGRVAAYARGPDYHTVIRERLNTLASWLMHESPGCYARGVVDTAPLLERDFARRAGLGWIGKNTMLIHPQRGSFFLLAAVVTDLELTADEPFTANHCGTCTACLDACPTQAFPQPGTLDATKCISYLTIEHRSAIPLDLRPDVGDWLHGCDVCQTVCPWNRFAGQAVALPSDPALETLDCVELLTLTEAQFRDRFRETALFRDKRRGLLRNACIVLGNTGDTSALSALNVAKNDPEELIAEAAAWAVEQIRGRPLSPQRGVGRNLWSRN